MKYLCAGAAVTLMMIGPAAAADLPVKAAVKVPPPALSWTGFYLGANLGYGWGRTGSQVDSFDPNGSDGFLSGTANGWFNVDQFTSSLRHSGVLGGAQAGYNWQFSNWVGGIETDIQYADLRGSSRSTLFLQPGSFGNTFPFTNDTARTLQWFGTLRGRLGFLATPNLLLYGTGGLAYGETRASGTISIAPPPGFSNSTSVGGLSCAATGPATTVCYSGSGSRTSVGWAAGAGGEYKLSANWSAKLEYLHVELPGQTITMTSPSPPSAAGLFINYRFDRESVDIVRVGVNYQFSSAAPLVAKY
jgi:outer membrane immunogenic protein